MSFHFSSFHSISFHCVSVFISFHFISFHFISSRFGSFYFMSFHFVSLHFVALRFISFRGLSFHFILCPFLSFRSSFQLPASSSRRSCHAWAAQLQRPGYKSGCQKASIGEIGLAGFVSSRGKAGVGGHDFCEVWICKACLFCVLGFALQYAANWLAQPLSRAQQFTAHPPVHFATLTCLDKFAFAV